MEVKKLIFPRKGEYYLKVIFQKTEKGVSVNCGSVFLTKGDILPFKTLNAHEVSYLVSGKLKVFTNDGNEQEMQAGDLIYLNKDEVRETVTIEDSEILFFLFKDELK